MITKLEKLQQIKKTTVILLLNMKITKLHSLHAQQTLNSVGDKEAL